jgi:NAD(P)-dependent dehydrogenase (short-subunit alcohol dehydrogenase family)
MSKLEGKTALVIGGSSGIGLASAKLLQNEGARIAVTGRDPGGLTRAAEELGSDALVIRSDAGVLPQIEALMEQVGSHFGRLDILFFNAGIWKPVPIEQITGAQFDETMEINFKGAFFAIQKALPIFSDHASVVVHTSIHNRKGSPNDCIYAASKAALRSLVQSMSLSFINRHSRQFDRHGADRYADVQPRRHSGGAYAAPLGCACAEVADKTVRHPGRGS